MRLSILLPFVESRALEPNLIKHIIVHIIYTLCILGAGNREPETCDGSEARGTQRPQRTLPHLWCGHPATWVPEHVRATLAHRRAIITHYIILTLVKVS